MSEPIRDEATRWRALAEKAAGGGVDALASVSVDGVPIAPLYPRRANDSPRPWRAGVWSVAMRVDHPDAASANRLALLDLEGGADALTLVAPGGTARGFGLPARGFAEALEGVELDFIGLRLDAGADTLEGAEALAHIIATRRLTSAALAIDLGCDPIGLSARTGGLARFDDLATILRLADDAGLAGRPLLADGRPYHEAGAGEAQELAAVLATGVAYLRRLERLGRSLDAGRGALAFLLAFDADVFLGLAKARAIRRLWARVEAASGLTAKPIKPARGDILADDDAARPLDQCDARDRRDVRGRGRRGRHDRRAALHPRARPSGRAGPPPRPQRAAGADRRGEPRQGRGSRRRLGRARRD